MADKVLDVKALTKTFGGLKAVDSVDLDVEKGELTPTMKLRRRIVEERFKDLLDSLYDE